MDEQLLIALRAYLIEVGLVREPRTAGPEPPMWLDPKAVPAPGEKPAGGKAVEAGDLVVAAFPAPGVPHGSFYGFVSHDAVELWLRAKVAPDAYELNAELYRHLNDKRNWNMGAVHVEESLQLRKFQRMAADPQGYTYTVQFGFEVMVGDPV